MNRALHIRALVGLSALCFSASAAAQGVNEVAVPLGSKLSLDPTNPQVGALPGGMTPSFGQKPADINDWRFDFHGFLTAPLRAGINTRENPQPGQSSTVLHAPPVVPDDKPTFSHTGVVPTPYTQLNLSYGNSRVTGHVSVVADQSSVSTGFFDPPSQLGVNDLFVSVVPELGSSALLNIRVGGFTSRYGTMGEYDEGRYGTPVIARIKGVGESISAALDLGDLTLMLDQGIKGQSNKAASDLSPAGWNDFGNANEGSTFVTHFNAGLSYRGWATLGLHYINAFSADERATGPNASDGSMTVLGADLRFNMRQWGHFYSVLSHTDAEAVGTISRIIEILNTRGGPDLIQNYLGDRSNGNGSLLTLAMQYDLSVGRLLSYPVQFYPDGPDLFLSVFGMQTMVESDDARQDGVTKRKFGTELTYSLLSWLAASVRYDRVDPNVDNQRYSFAVVSPRLIFRSDWTSTDQVVLQYSQWFNGSLTTVRTGYPPRDDVTAIPDESMISLSASMWW